MSADIFETSAGDLKLVEETALDRQFEDLVTFDANPNWGDLRFTKEQLDRMNNHMLRKLAQYANTSEIHGKSTALEIRQFYCVQRSLSEYSRKPK